MIRISTFRTSAVVLSALLTFASCDSKRVFEDNKDIPESIWNNQYKVPFNVVIEDTISQHTFYVNVRNADGYPYSNIYLFINTKMPDGKQSRDTLECILADENGQFLGKGMGDIYDNRILFKRGVRFPRKGTYQFELEQAMRDSLLPFIMDVGLRIEKMQ